MYNTFIRRVQRGSTNCQDEHRSKRPNEVTTPEVVKKIHKTVLDIRKKYTSHIKNLNMRKLSLIWVPANATQ